MIALPGNRASGLQERLGSESFLLAVQPKQSASIASWACVWLVCLSPFLTWSARAEDGYELWLRYRPVEAPWASRYRGVIREITPSSPAQTAAREELELALRGMLGSAPAVTANVTHDHVLVFGTPQSSPAIAAARLDLTGLPPDGYVLRSMTVSGHRATVIAAPSDAGVLYGVFHLLRLMQTRQPIEHLALRVAPRNPRRMLNHWDNLDGTIERGYAGGSIWDWQKLPDYLSPRYRDYARACASLGINGAVLTNVNADAASLTPRYLAKSAALANVFRAFGIRLYMTPRFTAPMELGGLKTADPLDPAVRAWWQQKVDEIYRYIPDFGGFLVKANSEGQPGPQDYRRTHAEGANLFADALAPHGGIVIWRAFVYSSHPGEDRAKQAFDEFTPLDGQFRSNVMLQVKNGAVDFQPREPAHPLFGAMPKTPMVLEVQLTKEYLGFATHLVYLAPLYQETLRFDTLTQGAGSPVAKLIAGMAGVSNVGADRNWTGSHFDQANWYAFGRLAWDPSLEARDIAEEWVRMTFSNDSRFVAPVVNMMMGSREAAVDYMTPLGLAHLMAAGHHYGPGAWQHSLSRDDWYPPYYHRADAQGIGFDRSSSGSNAVSQYAPPLAALFNDVSSTPTQYLLWFHHLPWDFLMPSGRPLWDEIALHYEHGVDYVQAMRKTWATLAPYVDAERYGEVKAFLGIQEREAQWWRDATLLYFQSISHRPLPVGVAAPARTLAEYEAIAVPYAPGNPGWTAAPFRH
jgi:alpha-glucuronidase